MKFLILSLALLLQSCVTTQTLQQTQNKSIVQPKSKPSPQPKVVPPKPLRKDILDPIAGLPKKPHEETDPFAQPTCMNKAVEFWENVYNTRNATIYIFNDKTHEIYIIEEDISWRNRHGIARRLINQVVNRYRLDRDDVKAQFGAGKTFAKGLEQGYKYIPFLQKKLKENNMPIDLAFIPLIESSFHFKARSKVGALGAWQIMPRTMKLYMKQTPKNRLYDLEFATDVAIKILKHNYELLGSWPLAVNAYHSGPGRLIKAKESLGTTDICKITQRFEGRGYKTASRNYYAQFLAAKNLYEKSIQTKLVSHNDNSITYE
jgi:membrane-bound lytic murein transglycosylase D